VHTLRPLLLFPLVLAAALLPGSGRAADPVLKATVGPGFTITLRTAAGTGVTRLQPGSYTIQVQDFSSEHNFHLKGPGVDQKTSVDATGTATWSVTFTNGTYTYLCDAHPVSMKGSFVAGTAPPPAPKLNGRVGPRRTISLRTAGGALVKSLRAGRYRVAVRDATRVDNFHLFGTGVNKRTGVRFRGSIVWRVAFRAGKTYTYRSDAHRRLRRTFNVTSRVQPPPPPPIAG
jgi:hypothetical protein